jgi:Flp pilus assembly pilin Flp
VTDTATSVEWPYLRAGFIAVMILVVAALIGWGIDSAFWEDKAFEKVSTCLVNEKGATLETTHDPIALSAELGALRTVIETNGITVSVASDAKSAEKLVAAYHSVGGELEGRLERRGRMVYLWDRPASPTQRQTMFDCQY